MSRQTANPNVAEATRSESVKSLARGLSVLRALSAADGSLTISEVAERTSLSRATARRLLLTLQELGYVTSTRRDFSLTSLVAELAKPPAESADPWESARPYLQSLSDRFGESASIAVLDGTEIRYVARTPARRLLTLAIRVGSRLPAHATSIGRVLLAFLPDAELEAFFSRWASARSTDQSAIDEPELRAVLGEVRCRGWVIVDQELEKGLCSVAAPMVDSSGRVSAALAIDAHSDRIDQLSMQRDVVPHVIETARRVSAGWSRH